METDWEREEEMRGYKIVCIHVCVWVCENVCGCRGEGGGTE